MMGERILIIEDDNGMQFFLSEALKKQGYEVVTYPDAEQALNWLEKETCEGHNSKVAYDEYGAHQEICKRCPKKQIDIK